MPCGSRALLTAYVAYQTLAFAERDVLLAALTQAGYRVETPPAGTETSNPLPVLDASRRIACKAALVVRRDQLAAGLGDLGFALRDGTYVPLLPAGARSEQLLQALRAAMRGRKLSNWRTSPTDASRPACTARLAPTAA